MYKLYHTQQLYEQLVHQSTAEAMNICMKLVYQKKALGTLRALSVMCNQLQLPSVLWLQRIKSAAGITTASAVYLAESIGKCQTGPRAWGDEHTIAPGWFCR